MAGGRGNKGRFPCLLLRLLRAGYRLLSILKPARHHAPHLEAELCYVWAAARTRLLLLARPRTPTHVTKLHSQVLFILWLCCYKAVARDVSESYHGSDL
ncbi:hypothetical protein Pcinc_043694 [Petrolisthes cinctipes]|uniref:Uncharacterized protein n=1 Tax=Petrolisthes cinctipes TaxID=88211 RepID=A0AAE1BG84_PETCI|nr:hypothetical protein Pcinc_043694 [Petrolisthes cinctipes]